MKRLAALSALGIIALCAAGPLVRQTFEKDAQGWTTFGPNGSVRITPGALTFDYDAGHGPCFAAWPVTAPLDSMRSLHFRISTDSPTALAILLNEKTPGGHYIRTVWSPGNTWQTIDLEPADFALTEGPNDPPDPDHRLDPGEVQSVGVFDVSQMFSAAAITSEAPIAIEPRTGQHNIRIAEFQVSADPIPHSAASEPGIIIDDFSRPFLQWITLGGMTLSWENHGVRARYQQEEDRYVILSRMLPPLDLRGWNRLAFDVASEKPATLFISLEEHNPGKGQGPRYGTTVGVLGGGKVDHRAISFSAFTPDQNGPSDPNGELDLDQLKTISILDITAAESHQTAANSLWIGNVRTAEKK